MPIGGDILATLSAASHKLVRLLLGLVLLAMTLANALNAGARYLFGTQMRGTDELLAFSQVGIVMLGLAVVTAERRHLAVDLFPAKSPINALRRLVLSLVTFAATLYAAIQSYAFVERMAAFGSKSMGLGVPMVIPHALVFVGFALTAAVALATALADARALVSEESRR